MEDLVRMVRSYSYEVSLGLLANQAVEECGFLSINYDSAVTAKGELLVFGTYDLEIAIVENHRNMAHHYVRYRTESFREWLAIPDNAAGARVVKADVKVVGAGCKVDGEDLNATLEVQAVLRVEKPEPKPEPKVEPPGVKPSKPRQSTVPKGYAHLFEDLELLRAYVRRQVGRSVDVLSVGGVQVVTDGETEGE